MRVNALLDEASTKSYVNSDVAAELGLKGKTEKITVNVLNGQIETFETKPVRFELQSVDGKVIFKVNAYMASRVTRDMNVIDWNEYHKKWPHLQSIKFPLYPYSTQATNRLNRHELIFSYSGGFVRFL